MNEQIPAPQHDSTDRTERSGALSHNLSRLFRGPGRQAMMLAATTGTAQLILAVLYIVTARGTTPSDYGLTVAAIAAGTSAVGFVDFGTNSYWIREIAQSRISPDQLSARVTGKLAAAAILSAIWVVALVILDPGSPLWVAGPICTAVISNQTLQVPLRGLARNDLVSLNIFSDKLVAALVFVVLGGVGIRPVDRLWICLVAGSFCAAMLGWFWTPRANRLWFRLMLRTNPWAGAGHYGLSTLATSAQTYDLPILGVAGGAFAAGVYGAVNRWTQPMGLLSGAFVSASLPFMAKATTFRKGLAVVKKGLWLPALAAIISLCVALLAPFIVSILLGAEYHSSANVLQALAIATVLGIINQPLFVFLQARRHDSAVSWIMVAGVVTQLVLVIVLGPMLKALGAALAIIALQIILLVGCGIVTIKIWQRNE